MLSLRWLRAYAPLFSICSFDAMPPLLITFIFFLSFHSLSCLRFIFRFFAITPRAARRFAATSSAPRFYAAAAARLYVLRCKRSPARQQRQRQCARVMCVQVRVMARRRRRRHAAPPSPTFASSAFDTLCPSAASLFSRLPVMPTPAHAARSFIFSLHVSLRGTAIHENELMPPGVVRRR